MTRNSFVPSRLVVVVLAVAAACASEQPPADTSAQAQQDTVLDHLPRQVTAMLAFQDQMRKLWEDHPAVPEQVPVARSDRSRSSTCRSMS